MSFVSHPFSILNCANDVVHLTTARFNREGFDQWGLDSYVLQFAWILMKRSPGLHAAFDLDTVKLLMSIFDTDRSGTIGFNEVRFNLFNPFSDCLRFHRSSPDSGNTSKIGKVSSNTSTKIAPVPSTVQSFKPPSNNSDIIYPLNSSISSKGNMVMPFSFPGGPAQLELIDDH